ncbi:MAG: glycosyltransferase [Alphaproteobacteria bacterium]|nr:glycosyltransferase [Alphaproteobacteria bacterium]
MSLAIHYSSIKPPTGQSRQVFGLQVAIADWIRAYLRHGRAEKFTFLIGDKAEADEIQDMAKAAGVDLKRLALLDRRFPEQNFANIATVFRPEPDTRNLLWQRQYAGDFSFCGLAHAISGTEAGEVLQEYCLAPSSDSDAIVCPSHAVQAAIRAFWDHYADYLKIRFGASFQCPVQLPVIPLGIDVDKFEQRVTPDKRNAQRGKLGIAENDIVLLWVGRLSAAIKAHPLAMFRAAEIAAEKTGANVHLVMQGYFVPEEAETQFKSLAAATCAKAKVTFVAANDKRFPDGLWAAGDIFLSLIDNMQESFGLTPIEAMAAGLPRVISDWDGYRDCIDDGEDGFLIRTTMPPAGNGFDLTAQVASGREVYGGFLAKSALTVAVDAAQAGERIATLIADKNLRAQMAERARARARAFYDWRNIIPMYEDLWGELAARRAAAPPPKQNWPSALPTLPDPYAMYAGFPTSCLDETATVALVATADRVKDLWQNDLNVYAGDTMLPPVEITALLGRLAETGPVMMATLFEDFPDSVKPRLWRTLAWLLKLGIVENLSGQPPLKA